MKKELTELVFILDKSGSMSGLESDTIGGYNAMLKKQGDLDGECYITTVLFNNKYELIHNRANIKGVNPLTDNEYQVGGTTALLDAIGFTIQKIINAQKHIKDSYRAKKVIFVIITDGAENSSREYSIQNVKNMIENQKENYGWEFIFLGANIDAVETAKGFGIESERALDYLADSRGTKMSYKVMSDAVRRFREEGKIYEEDFSEIREDYKKRRK